MNCIAIVLARSDSVRLPGKHFNKIGNLSLLEFIWHRLKVSQSIDRIVLATTCRSLDDDLVKLARKIGYVVVRGELNDVLKRFKLAADICSADIIVKVNGDSPFISAQLIDDMIIKMQVEMMGFITGKSKYSGYPIGVGAEIIEKSALVELVDKAPSKFRESITGYIFDKRQDLSFSICSADESKVIGFSHIDLTVDTKSDLEYVRRLWNELSSDDPGDVSLDELLSGIEALGE
jgi:spore coat polysaccharide biosynthesis protein SpsF